MGRVRRASPGMDCPSLGDLSTVGLTARNETQGEGKAMEGELAAVWHPVRAGMPADSGCEGMVLSAGGRPLRGGLS